MIKSAIKGRDTDKVSFSGKIAIITHLPSHTQNDEEIWSAGQLVAKYGSDKVIHATWPAFYTQDKEEANNVLSSLAVDGDIKVFIMNKPIPGCNAAVDKLRAVRNDIFIVYCLLTEPIAESVTRTNLMFSFNGMGMGSAMVKQAKKQGAKVFVHYSTPRHMALALIAKRHDIIRETCASEGIQFVSAEVSDPSIDMFNAQQFIHDDVPKKTAQFGEDTAFYCTNCFLQVPLISAVVENHAIYPQPCCPSPYHGFPEALGVEMPGEEAPALSYVVNESKRIIAGKNMTGRLSTWPVPVSMMLTHVGAEYAIKWLNGQVQKAEIDDAVLSDCINTYIKEVSGGDIGVSMTSYSEGDTAYNNYKLLLMDYLDY